MTEDRSASFVELFFDLVFVFGITQVVVSIHGHLDWPTLWRAAVVLFLLWWAWSQYTWLAGQADFDDVGPRVVMLLATAGTFLLAVSVQDAWGPDGEFFGLGYFGVMLLAGIFFLARTAGTDDMAGAIAYIPRVLAGAALVLAGGFFDGDSRTWLWLAGIVVTILSSVAAGRFEYKLNDAHFAERHGLFVIIVLGEALIAIGVSTLGHDGSMSFYVGGTAALLTVLAMWWSYFDWPYKVGELALKRATGTEEARMARDAYTIGHFPLVSGVVLFAVGMEELLAHPGDAVPEAVRWAIAGGLGLFLTAIAFGAWRWAHEVAWERLTLVAVLLASAAFMGSVAGGWLAAWIAGVTVVALTVESVRHRSDIEELRALG